MDHHNEEYSQPQKKLGKQHNVLPLWGNEATMNLNPLILANIQSSSYFKVHLFKLKTYHEVVDEIYYQVKHLEPWERGSRKTAGQTGMCGGVRGVGAGGIVSTAYCLLYKLYTLRLTRKQLNGLLTHTDSPYIRSLGFMYIRYTQPPADLYDWYEEYLQDEEEVEPKAGGGQIMTIGQMLHQWLIKLDWFCTLFPRIPVPIQKQIEKKLANYSREHNVNFQTNFNVASSATSAQTESSSNFGQNKRYGGGGGGGGGGGSGGGGGIDSSGRNDYYDRNDRSSGSYGFGGGGGGGGGSSSTSNRYDRDSHDRRYRSRSRERTNGGSGSSSSYGDSKYNSADKHRSRGSGGGDDQYPSKTRTDKRDKDSYSYGSGSGGGGGGSSSYKDRHDSTERNYRSNGGVSSSYRSGSSNTISSHRHHRDRDREYDRDRKYR